MRVLLLELNEITWRLIDPLVAAGTLPTFASLKARAAWGAPRSVEVAPQLDPWVTWTTVYTGVPQSVHRVFFLEQPAATIRARRLWDLVADAGLPIGVFGSLNSWPPRPVAGFWVPGTFAPDPATHPPSLRPVQELNLTYTRGYHYDRSRVRASPAATLALGLRLLALGLRPGTIGRVAAQLARERVDRRRIWRRVSLQPLINFDVFAALYRRHRPHFATFHTNHVAHYQHLYWRAMDPTPFPLPPAPGERATYGRAIEHGYTVADRLLRRALALLDGDTVLVVASSMGQQPYVDARLHRGKRLLRVRSFEALLDLLDLGDRAGVVPTMSDQFNVHPADADARRRARAALASAWVDRPDQPVFFLGADVPGAFTVNLNQYDGLSEDSPCEVLVGGRARRLRYGEVVDVFDHTKSGFHHPEGMLMVHGPGIAAGPLEGETTTLDLAPTMLALMQLPVPGAMRGRVLLGRPRPAVVTA